MLLTILIFLLLLSVLVLIHELGHFLVAKKLGIKVEEFGFGFPPRLIGIKRGETVYSINALPIGGFVKLFGEDEVGGGSLKIKKSELKSEYSDIKRAFFARPASQRAVVIIAGVLMNVFLAVIIYYIFLSLSNFKTQLVLLGDYKFSNVNQTNYNTKKAEVISIIAPDSPAEKAGMKPPLKIIKVNGKEIKDASVFVKLAGESRGKALTITWEELSSKQRFTKEIIPRLTPPKNEGPLGIGFFPVALLHYETFTQKILSGFSHPYNLMAYNFDIMGKLISISLKEKTATPISEGVSGPIGIASIVGSIVGIEDLQEMVLQLLNLAGLLSISLAFFNILPIPALDGGRLFFVLIEMFSGKKISQRYETLIHAVGFAILLGLVVLVSINDVLKLLPR